MLTHNTLGDLLTTLFERRVFGRKIHDKRDIRDICLDLLSETAETSERQLAATVLERYRRLDIDAKAAFFEFLNEELDLVADDIEKSAQRYGDDPSPDNFKALAQVCEPRRQRLFSPIERGARSNGGNRENARKPFGPAEEHARTRENRP